MPAPVASRATVNSTMLARGLKSAAELAVYKPCGTRVRYYAGCRCEACRSANTAYERQRAIARKAGEWNGLVDANRARAHIDQLTQRGIGWRTVADAAKVASSIITAIKTGKRTRIRAQAEKRILGVNEACAADGAFTDAGPSWLLLDDLVACGYSRARLASEILGRPARALQLSRDRITVRNAERVRRVHSRLHYASVQDSARARLQLAELSEEGFNRQRVQRWLDAMANKMGLEPVDLVAKTDMRLRASTVAVVAALHRHLLGEEDVSS